MRGREREKKIQREREEVTLWRAALMTTEIRGKSNQFLKIII
jgi:hypothetical protein